MAVFQTVLAGSIPASCKKNIIFYNISLNYGKIGRKLYKSKFYINSKNQKESWLSQV